jgi:Fe-S cluster biogenesis protein NfuA
MENSMETITNPNDKALTISVADLDNLSDVQRAVIIRPSVPRFKINKKVEIPFSGFAEKAFNELGAVSRIDFVRDHAGLQISAVLKLGAWNDKSQQKFQQVVNDSEGDYFDPELLKASLKEIKPFQPEDTIDEQIKEAFDISVKPSIDEHGGALEIKAIDLYEGEGLEVSLILMGSCSDCGTSTDKTLKAAENAIRARIEMMKEDFPNQQKVQDLEFAGLVTIPVQNGFWMPRL